MLTRQPRLRGKSKLHHSKLIEGRGNRTSSQAAAMVDRLESKGPEARSPTDELILRINVQVSKP